MANQAAGAAQRSPGSVLAKTSGAPLRRARGLAVSSWRSLASTPPLVDRPTQRLGFRGVLRRQVLFLARIVAQVVQRRRLLLRVEGDQFAVGPAHPAVREVQHGLVQVYRGVGEDLAEDRVAREWGLTRCGRQQVEPGHLGRRFY